MKSFSRYLSEDHDGQMAISQLRSIVDNATKLLEMMNSETNLEPWVQSKLTKAQDYISVVHDYMTHTPEDSMEEGSLLPSERNDQQTYRNTSSGSKVAMKYWNKSQKPNYKPDASASVRAKKVRRGEYHA
jgi:hypothetical protein